MLQVVHACLSRPFNFNFKTGTGVLHTTRARLAESPQSSMALLVEGGDLYCNRLQISVLQSWVWGGVKPALAASQPEPVNIAKSINGYDYDLVSQPVLDRPVNQRPPPTMRMFWYGMVPLLPPGSQSMQPGGGSWAGRRLSMLRLSPFRPRLFGDGFRFHRHQR
jgi:hypothetical protein